MTMELIETKTLGTAAASITFTSIPQDGTDLLLLASLRATGDTVVGGVRFNGDTGSNFTVRRLEGNGSSVSTGSTNSTSFQTRLVVASSYTANTFSNHALYIPNYTGSTQKAVSIDVSIENNATSGPNLIESGLWTGTAAVTTILYFGNIGDLTAGSTISLYKITKGSDGIVTTTIS